MPQEPRADAPRLRAYLPYAEGRPVFTSSRSDWDRLGLSPGEEFLIDVTQTPLNRIVSQATVLATKAIQFSSASAELTVFRDDPADAPKRVNVDRYAVWTDLRSHRSFPDMVSAASTELNENMNTFLDENVFFVKLPPDDDHHMPDLPATVRALLSSSSSGA